MLRSYRSYLLRALAISTLSSCTIHHYAAPAPAPAPAPKPVAKAAPKAVAPAKPKAKAKAATKPVHTAAATPRPKPRRTTVPRPATGAAARTLPSDTPAYAERAPVTQFVMVDRAASTDVGRGFNSVSGRLGRSGCVEVADAPDQAIRGARTSVDLMYVSNSSQLFDAFNVGAKASGIINVLSLGGKAAYAESQAAVSESEYLILRIVVEGEKITGKSFELSDAAKKLLAAKHTAKFYEVCGDQFVAGYVPGIEFFAIVRTTRDALSDSMKESFRGSAGIPLLASVEIEVAKDYYNEATRKTKDVHVFASGGNGTTSITIDINKLLDNPTDFLPQAAASPAVLQLVVENYTSAEGLPSAASLETHPLAQNDLDTLLQLQRVSAVRKLTTDAFSSHFHWWQGKIQDKTEECKWVDRGFLWSDWQVVCKTKIASKALDGCQVAWLLDERYESTWNGTTTLDRQACPSAGLRRNPAMCKRLRSALERAPARLAESVLRCLDRPATCRAEATTAARLEIPTFSEFYRTCVPPLNSPGIGVAG